MKIRVGLQGTLGKIAVPEEEVSLPENSRVSDLLEFLVNQHGDEFGNRIKYAGMWQVSINGNLHILPSAAETELKNQDEVIILPLIFGG